MKKVRTLLLGAVTAGVLSTFAAPGAYAAKQYRIAVLTYGLPEYCAHWVQEIEDHPMVKNGTVKVTILDGKFDAALQSNQMDTAITQRYDAIILSAMDYKASAAPVARAAAAHIPVINSVNRAGSDKLYSFIATDDVEGGRMIADHVVKELNGKGNVVIIEGPIGQSPQLMRRQGIDAVLKANPGVKVLATKSADWSRAESLATMENWLALYGNKIDAVIAENDEMGLGAIQALREKGLDPKKVHVVSIDGIKDGQRAVKDGDLFTLYKDAAAEGQGAMDLAIRSVMGPSYQPQAAVWKQGLDWKDGNQKQYNVPWVPLTAENVGQYLSQK